MAVTPNSTPKPGVEISPATGLLTQQRGWIYAVLLLVAIALAVFGDSCERRAASLSLLSVRCPAVATPAGHAFPLT